MNCQSCGHPIQPGDTMCINCGTHITVPNAPIQPPPPVTPIQPPPAEEASQIHETVHEVSSFFKNSFWGIVKAIIAKPIQGTYDIFQHAKGEAHRHAWILIGTTGAAYFLLPLLFFGKFLGESAFGTSFKLGILIMLLLLSISVFTYLVKSMSGKPDFKRELLTGGLCGIPFLILIIYFSIIGVNYVDEFTLFGNIESPGLIYLLVLIFVFLMLINIIQQSLRSAGTKDAMSWYLSPLILIASLYITNVIGRDVLLSGWWWVD